MRPDLFLLQRVVGVALGEEMLEEAHILKTEQGDLAMRLLAQYQYAVFCLSVLSTDLMSDLGQRRVLALEARLDAVPACWAILLTLDTA